MNLYAFRYLHLKLIICFSNPGSRTVFAFGTKVKNLVNDKCPSCITVTTQKHRAIVLGETLTATL